MTKQRNESFARLARLGINYDDSRALIRAAAVLHTWAEHECNGVIQRDEVTNKPYWHSSYSGKRLDATSDREAGAARRVNAIAAKYGLLAYIQGDPRGDSLYLYSAESLAKYAARNGYTPEIDSVYSSIGVAV